MGNGKFTEHAQNLQGCEKYNLRKAVGILEMPYGCKFTVIAQEGLKACYTSVLYYLINAIVQEGLKLCYTSMLYYLLNVKVQEGLRNSYTK